MNNIFKITRHTKRQLGSFFNENFSQQLAIIDNICQRCGHEVLSNECLNCCEFGHIDRSTNLYYIDEEIELPTYIVKPLNINFTHLQLEASKFIKSLTLNHKDGLIWAVCGAGKTEITFPAIEQALIANKLICFAIPRLDILYEVCDRLKETFPSVKIAVLNGNEPKFQDAQIYVMTTNQIIKFKNAFSLVIVDEVDAFPYEYNGKYDYGVRHALTNDGIVIYLTSTPSQLILNKKLDTYIINRRWHGFDLPVPKFVYSNINVVLKNRIPICIYWFIYKHKRQQLWFVSNVELGNKIYKVMSKKKFKYQFAFVHANDCKRREKIKLFHEGVIDILITTTILERGVTFEDVDVIVLDASSEIYNLAALVQIAGRVGRKKDFQAGKVYFLHTSVTKVMKLARKQICKMNVNKNF